MKKFDFIIILSAPRSGSTFLKQLLLKNFRLCYFSNKDEKIFNRERKLKFTNSSRYKISLSNNFGKTYKSTDPTEGSSFLKYWFGKQINLLKIKKKPQYKHFCQSLEFLKNECKYPFIFKNPWILERIPLFQLQSKKILFINLKRDLLDACYSTLISKYSTQSKPTNDISYKPSSINYSKYKLLEEKIIAYQKGYIQQIDKIVKNKIKISISYESLLTNQLNEIQKFSRKLELHKNSFFINKKKFISYSSSFKNDIFFSRKKNKLKLLIKNDRNFK